MPQASYPFTVEGQKAGFNNVLKLSGLADLLQMAAWRHAHDLGFGVETMMEQNQFWALSRMRIDIDSFPGYGSEVMVTTWPKSRDKFFAYRDLTLSKNDTVFARATSSYALVDIKSRRPIPLDSMPDSISLHNQHAIEDHAIKIEFNKGENVKHIQVENMDLDVHRHVNNIKYLDWAVNTLPLKYWYGNQVSRVEINFLRELWVENDIELHWTLDNNTLKVCGKTLGKDAFRVVLTMKAREFSKP